MSNFAHVRAPLTASSLLVWTKLCWSIFRVMVLIVHFYSSPESTHKLYWKNKRTKPQKTPTQTGFELQNHRKKRRKYKNNRRPRRKLVSVYFIYCRWKGNDWPFGQTSRSTCFQGALIQIWAVIMWKIVLIVIILTLSVNLDKTCFPLSSEILTTTLKFWVKFCMGFPDLRSVLDNIKSK